MEMQARGVGANELDAIEACAAYVGAQQSYAQHKRTVAGTQEYAENISSLQVPKEFAEASKTLAANQGLYNGFLAAGLVWGLLLGPAGYGVKLFFLGCILVAGLYGGLTATRKILFIQAIPAAIGIALVLAAANC